MKNVEEFLEKQLQSMTNWLTFAEAKNAALVAVNIAIIAFLADILKEYFVWFTIITIVLICSSAISIWSFFSDGTRKASRKSKGKDEAVKPNLLFWGDIAKSKGAEGYLAQVVDRYFPDHWEEAKTAAICIDLANQIVILSRIAARKFYLFNLALKILILAFVFIVLCLIVA